MSSPARQSTQPRLNYDSSTPSAWSAAMFANAERSLVDHLAPYIVDCLCGRPTLNASLLDKKGLKFKFVEKMNDVLLKRSPLGVKMTTPPATSEHSFKVICGNPGRYAFGVVVILLSGSYEDALNLFNYMKEGPLKGEDKKKGNQLPSPPSPVITLFPPPAEKKPVPSVQLSEEEVADRYPDSQMHPLFLAHLHQNANGGKGFADPISKEEISGLRMKFFEEYMPELITNAKIRGSIVGLFTNRAKIDGLLARHYQTEDWYITPAGASMIGISQYAELPPDLRKMNSLSRDYAERVRALALEQVPVVPPVGPPATIPSSKAVTPSPKLEDQIQELRDTKARNTQTIERLLAENETIDPRIADLEEAIRRRDEESNQQLLKELEQQEVSLRAQMEELAKKRQALTGSA